VKDQKTKMPRVCRTNKDHEWHAFHVAPPEGPPIVVGLRCVKCGMYQVHKPEQRLGEDVV
jgi:hypothetical protein